MFENNCSGHLHLSTYPLPSTLTLGQESKCDTEEDGQEHAIFYLNPAGIPSGWTSQAENWTWLDRPR